MYHLLAGIYADWTKPCLTNVLLVGPSRSGKTALLARLRASPEAGAAPSSSAASSGMTASRAASVKTSEGALKLKGIAPTVGQNVLELRPPTAPWRTQLRIWDLGGALPLRDMWQRYVAETHVLVWCVDVTWWAPVSDGGETGQLSETDRIEAERKERREDAWKALESLLGHPSLAATPVLLYASDLGYFGSLETLLVQQYEDEAFAHPEAVSEDAGVDSESIAAKAKDQVRVRAEEALARLRADVGVRIAEKGREAPILPGWGQDANTNEVISWLVAHAVTASE